MKPKRQQITITTSQGPVEIEAMVIGPFAYCKDRYQMQRITHLATGCYAGMATSVANAKRYIQALIDTGIDWDAVKDPSLPDGVKDRIQAVVRQYRNDGALL